jgi:hypothetical protein
VCNPVLVERQVKGVRVLRTSSAEEDGALD